MKASLVVIVAAACGSSQRTVATAPAAHASKGRVETRHFHSDALGVDKDYVVYLPAGYDAGATRFPVFYYLHGLGDDERMWIDGAHLDQAADAIGLAAIVVMPDGDDGFYADWPHPVDYDACLADGTGLYKPEEPRAKTCVRYPRYETYIVKDLLGDVDTHFRTIAKREARGIAGLSMGGLGAFELAMRHQDLFAAAASHAGVVALLYDGPHPYVAGQTKLTTDVRTWGSKAGAIGAWVRNVYGEDLATWQASDPAALLDKLDGKLALYLDCGTEDNYRLQDGAQYVHELLVARHLEHTFFLGPGHHDLAFASARLPESFRFLSAHVARAQ